MGLGVARWTAQLSKLNDVCNFLFWEGVWYIVVRGNSSPSGIIHLIHCIDLLFRRGW